jgi:pimeloyl-ACP methyl ester carboxylesterase
MTDRVRTVMLRHVRVDLALHELRPGNGRPLLLLHGLAERTPSRVPVPASGWPGPVWGLDFTGHGDSTVPSGGGYTAEILMADADHALNELGEATVLGRGLGAYVALLLAGARPARVRGAVLTDGPGLAGGGPAPGSPSVAERPSGSGAPDPFAVVELTTDVRPPDYASTYARQALQLSGLDVPVVVSAVVRPPWLAAVADEPGVSSLPIAQALRSFSSGVS